jgi:ABC-2 type transport system ATP-binding protein
MAKPPAIEPIRHGTACTDEGVVAGNMIKVDRLSKRFGSYKAVDDVSFEVGNGEIVGLLGPNGAGKTTTMRMLTTYLNPTSGRASLAGHDVLDEPLEVRRKLGYLPESVPLYGEMRVREFLRFRAKLKDVPRSALRRAVSEVVSRCRLDEVENRIVGQLSRGYRQRVGLAEALLHDPPILILDEPTSGLDPIQILEVRALIRELGARHTILLSTHILPEVEAVCSRVIIIARGRIAVDERLDDLRRDSAIVVEARGPADAIRGALQTVPGVDRVITDLEDGPYAEFRVLTRDGRDLREAIGQKLAGGGWPLRRLDLRRSSLEERFIQAVNRETLADAQREAS